MFKSEPKRGLVIGLVGPVCAGKSEALRRLRELGAEVYEADAIVRKLYEQSDVKDAVRELFGAEVFEPDGSVNRSAIARRVFGPDGDSNLRRRLTDEVIFPRTGSILRTALDRFRAAAGPHDVLVLDAPTLIEAGRADWCDEILLVTAPTDRRCEWAAARGWPPDELERRDAAMLPESEKRRQAQHVIENSGSLAELRDAVDRVWQVLRGPETPRTGGPLPGS
jgi:dephospho-CoA kinase